MDRNASKQKRRLRRRVGIRRAVSGTQTRPRLCVYKSLNHFYAQVIDDLKGTTLAAASTRDKELGLAKTGNAGAAAQVGTLIAQRAKKAGVELVVFDRGGFKYHGRVKALGDAARKEGLKF